MQSHHIKFADKMPLLMRTNYQQICGQKSH
jgi:hypothetical protein